MKQVVAILLVLIANFGNSQTKLIAHKSHGGTAADFSEALLHDRSLSYSNFGEAPIHFVSDARLDSVIYVNDSTVVMVTSLNSEHLTSNRRINSRMACKPDDMEVAVVWKPGRDTLNNHEVFSSGLSIEEMKDRIATEYYFANEASTVKFIGFENRPLETKAKQNDGSGLTPLALPRNQGPGLLILIGFIVFASFWWKLKQLEKGRVWE